MPRPMMDGAFLFPAFFDLCTLRVGQEVKVIYVTASICQH
jgi:hypothetical protein